MLRGKDAGVSFIMARRCAAIWEIKKRMMTFEHAHEALRFAHNYNRTNIMLDLYEQMQRSDWLKIVGDEWVATDNMSTLLLRFKKALGLKGPLLEMMTSAEQLRYDSLPSTLSSIGDVASLIKEPAAFTV
jgi:hypothetical protein